MGKVIKIFVHTVSAVVLTLIIVPVVFSLMLNLTSFQNYIVNRLTKSISSKLETTVSIDRVKLSLFNKVVIDGLYIEDYGKDTLLYVNRLSVNINSLGITSDDISLGAVKLHNTQFNMRQMSSGVSNLKEILLKLNSDKPKSGKKFALKAASLTIDTMDYKFRNLIPKHRDYGVNFDDIDVTDFSLDAGKISVIGDSITLNIKNISLREKSGFTVNSLSSASVSVSGRGILLDRMTLDTPHSQLNADFLYMKSDSWASYINFIEEVRIESKIVNSTISYRTIAYFAPTLSKWQSSYEDVTATVSGTVEAMSGSITSLKMNDTNLSAQFGLYGLPDVKNTRFEIDIPHLHTNIKDVDAIVSEISGSSLLARAKMLSQLGTISVNGKFKGLLNSFKADANLKSDIGNVNLDMKFAPDKSHKSTFNGHLEVINANMGKLLSNKSMGLASISAKMDGKLGVGDLKINTSAALSKLELNSYTYRDISLKGVINNRTYKGLITSADPNIKFDFNGLLDFTDSIPKYDFDMQLFNADLHTLNLNPRDSISLLSCDVKVSGNGNNMDNINGVVTIDKLLYINPIDSVQTDEIKLIGDNSKNHKSLALHSSFADVQFKSRLSYKHMFVYLKSVLQEHLPMLTKDDQQSSIDYKSNENGNAADISGYSLLTVNVKEANNVAGIFLPGLQLAQGSKLSFMFNPNARQFSLSVLSDYIEHERFLISKLNINSRSQSDSISLFVRAEDLYAAGLYMPNFSVIGGAKQTRFNVSTKFNDPRTGLGALIGVVASLKQNEQTGASEMHIGLTPSSITSNNRTWRLVSRNIIYDTTRISIENFSILSEGQALSINGAVSKLSSDTLHLKLKNFDIAPFSQFTSRGGYTLSGITDGYADIASAMLHPSVYAHISFDKMKINDVQVPYTLFESTWDFLNERAKVTVTTAGSPTPIMLGYYRPTDGRYRVDVNINDIDLSLIDPVLSDVLKNSSGRADANLILTGEKQMPTLKGAIKVRQMKTTVEYTNVEYSLKDAQIDVVDNNFTLRPTNVYDTQGNRGEIEMSLGSHYFSNITYDLKIRPHNLMVINTTIADNDLFYGKVYASGAAQIKGDKRGVDMNIVATTDDNSAFFMPLSGKSNISEADFILFEQTKIATIDTTNTDYLVRKRMMFDKKNKASSSGSSVKGNMNINMAITVNPNTDFQLVIDPTVGDILKGRGNGLLNININPADNIFTMYGDYQITEGSYLFTLQNIINKKFIIEPGSTIKWTGEPLDALLDITATYKLKATLAPLLNKDDENLRRSVPVDCRIHFTERLSQPAITFGVSVQNIDPETQSLVANAINTQEMMATQFFWLLAVNSFYADTSTGASSSIGAMSGSVTGFEFLSNQLSNWISSDKYNIGIRYRPKSEITSDELDIGLSTALIDNRLLLEVEGNYDFGNNATMTNRTANSLSGDFYLTWLIDRAGNLKAKAFSRTIDRFDENQGLQENGMGMYYKEDFNTFKDIITNIKERFRRKNKDKNKIN